MKRIGLIELDTRWKDVAENLRQAAALLAQARQEACQLAVLPEMFATGFVVEPDYPLEPADGPTAQFLSTSARSLSMGIVAGLAVVDLDGQRRNRAAYFDRQGRLIASYAKRRPFTRAGEHQSVTAGDGPVVFDCDGMSASLFICYDLRFPELFRDVRPLPECMIVLANWPSARTHHWLTLLAARAIENQCFVVGVNRTGTDGNGWHFAGHSAVFAPDGCAVSLRDDRRPLRICEIDPGAVEAYRRAFPMPS